ncbi:MULTISPECIES: hypothetical protein [unclassified Bradyrhizobium]|nr:MULTISPECIES: hypothetical protein [unclassified Bradyrhizobium]
MLFHLDEPVQELSKLDADQLAEVVSDLLGAARLGYHVVAISRTSASWINANIDLSMRERAMLSRISSDYTQAAGLRKVAKRYINLTSNDLLHLGVTGNCVSVAVLRLKQCRLLERSVLLVENINSDGAIYEFLLSNRHKSIGCPAISFVRYHGGGDDLPKVMEHLIVERRIVCAVVDSDKSAPISFNKKMHRLSKVSDGFSWPLCFLLTPPAREAESLVPLAIVAQLPCGKGSVTNGVHLNIAAAEKVGGHASTDAFWLYFDLKEGVSVEKVNRLNDAERDWLTGKLSLVGIDPAHVSIPGYGENIIKQLFESNRLLGEYRDAVQHRSWRDVFDHFISEMVWIFAGAPRVRT